MRRNLILCGALAGLLTVASAEETSAPTLIYYDNTANVLDLTNATAWVGGVVPGSNDVAVFDGAVPATLNLGAETVWAGIVRTNVTAALTLQAPSNGTLALGAQGWRLSGTNQNFNRMYLVANVIAAADQTWFWCSNKTPCVTGSLAGPGTITLETLKDSWGNGVGNCIVEGPSTASVTVGVKNTLFAFGDARWNPPPTLQWDATLSLLPDRAADGTNLFSTIFPNRSFPLGGWLSFGVPDGNTSWISQPRTFKLTAGDTICAHLTDATSDRQKGHLRVQDADVISDGATVTSNSWFDLRSGSWTQRAGDTAFNYAAIIGRLSAVNYGLQRQRLQVEGGTFTARRVNVGMGNCDKVPAVLRVTDGTLTCSDIAGAGWAAGLSIGQRVASGEEYTYWDNEKNQNVPRVLFGQHIRRRTTGDFGRVRAHTVRHLRRSQRSRMACGYPFRGPPGARGRGTPDRGGGLLDGAEVASGRGDFAGRCVVLRRPADGRHACVLFARAHHERRCAAREPGRRHDLVRVERGDGNGVRRPLGGGRSP